MTTTICIDATTTGATVSEDALRAGIDAFRAVLDRVAADGIACLGLGDGEEATEIWHEANRAGLNAVADAVGDESCVSFSVSRVN